MEGYIFNFFFGGGGRAASKNAGVMDRDVSRSVYLAI
jgi:hypothetical protein